MNGRGFRVGLAVAALAIAAAIVVPVAAARSQSNALLPSCGAETTPFAQWGDFDGYCAFPNLGFESGAAGWTLAGPAAVAAGNEPWYVSGPGSNSLVLGPGATAVSPQLPISALDPWVRFFARAAGANRSLSVQVRFNGWLGNVTGLLNAGTLSPGSFAGWQPTPPVLSALAVPLGTSTVQVVLRNEGTAGNWAVDDFYLDPCVSRVR